MLFIHSNNNLNFRCYNKLYSDLNHSEAFQNRQNCPISDPLEKDVVLSGTSNFWTFFAVYQSRVCFLILIIWAGLMYDSAQELYPNYGITKFAKV